MKKLLVTVAVLAMFGLASCNKAETTEEVTASGVTAEEVATGVTVDAATGVVAEEVTTEVATGVTTEVATGVVTEVSTGVVVDTTATGAAQ